LLSKQEKQIITKDIKIGNVNKGTILLKARQKSFDNYFVLKGCVRQFYLNEGEERTTNFYTEEDWILPAIDTSANQVSDYFLECTEDCVLVIANEQEGNELIKRYPLFQELSLMVLEKEIIKQQQKLATYHISTPEQRYINLQKDKPQLIERISQYLLSSYIGVEPESLSRIRKRIAIRQKS
jgi:CRP-like cAMP-binding protein